MKNIIKAFVRTQWPFLSCLALVLIPFFFVWLRGRLFYDFDMTFITAPIEDMFAHYQRAGQLPLWDPDLQMGYPLIAISHLGFFYPLHVVLRQFLPGVITLNISLFLHTILATVGMYLLLRQEKFQKQSSAIGAFVFAGTGFFVGRYYLTNVILPLSWTPLCLFLLGNWLKKKSYRSLLGLSLAIAMQILLGQPQAAMISAFSLIIYAIAHFSTDIKKTSLRLVPLIPAALLTILLSYAQIGATFSVIPYSDRVDAMLPSELYEFNLPFSHLVSWVFPHAFGYHENYIGAKNETELSSWLGITVLSLLVVGIFSIRRMPKRPLIFVSLLTILSLLMSSGETSPLYRYLVEHHWLDSLAIPARWILLLIIAISFMVAYGAEALIKASKRKRTTMLICAIFIILLVSYLSWLNVPTNIKTQVTANLTSEYFRTLIPFFTIPFILLLGRKVSEKNIILFIVLATAEILLPNLTRNVSVPALQPFHIASAEKTLQNAEPWGPRLFTQRDLSVSMEPQALFHQLKRLDTDVVIKQTFTSFGSELRGINLDLRWGGNVQTSTLIKLTTEDLDTKLQQTVTISAKDIKDRKGLEFIFSNTFKNTTNHNFLVTFSQTGDKQGPWVMYAAYPNSKSADFLPSGSSVVCMQGNCTNNTIKDTTNVDIALTPLYSSPNRIKLSQEILSPHIAAEKNIPSTQWLGALQLREVKRYLYEIGDQNENAVGYNPFISEKRQLLDRLGVGYLLGSFEKNRDIGDMSNIELIKETKSEGQTVRLYKNLEVAPRAEFVKNVASVTHPDGARAVLFDAKSAEDPVPVEDDTLLKDKVLSVGTVDFVSYKPTEVILKTKNNGDGFLILRDTFYQDWHAYVDGKETRILQSDWIFRGVIVPKGEHTITFKYLPEKTLTAIKISATSWLIIFLLTLLGFGIKLIRSNNIKVV